MRWVALAFTTSAVTLAAVSLAPACGNKIDVPTPAPTRYDAGASTTAQTCIDPSAVDAGTPTLTLRGCLRANESTGLAVFTWLNYTGEAMAAGYGPQNQILPGDPAQGQPESFAVGTSGSFAVPLSAGSVTWTLLGQSVVVDAASSSCEQCYQPQLADAGSSPVDLCTEACGDGLCNAAETCRSCASDCDCSAVEPLLDCVIPLQSGLTLASFGYLNLATRGGRFGDIAENVFTPGQAIQGQTSLFQPGESHHAFQVAFSGTELTWRLGALSVTATPTAPACAQSCTACSDETVCVEESCQQVCGDGQCTTEENCKLCPADCGCTEGRICTPGGSCFVPPQCGVQLECGNFNKYGVHLECGSCMEGQRCVTNQCVDC